jgi:hypothetical protein
MRENRNGNKILVRKSEEKRPHGESRPIWHLQVYMINIQHYFHTFFRMSFMSRKYWSPRCDNILRAMRHIMEAPEDQRVSSIGHSTA